MRAASYIWCLLLVADVSFISACALHLAKRDVQALDRDEASGCTFRPSDRSHLSAGMTKTINHFLINDSWYLVDLPGYGYAAALLLPLLQEYLLLWRLPGYLQGPDV